MPFDLPTFLLALAGLIIGAGGTWYARRTLLGPRIVLDGGTSGDAMAANDGARLVGGRGRAQNSGGTD